MKTALLAAVLLAAPALPSLGDESAKPAVAVSPSPLRGQIMAAIEKSGVRVGPLVTVERKADSPLPNCSDDHFSFSVPSVAPKGGQIFICSRKQYGDSIVAYFKQLAGLAGPYVYQSKDGRVVEQMSSKLAPAEAEKFEAAITGLTLAEAAGN